ncbi:MAG: hypothetical protein K8F25_03625, partial [Fimbriimonadaceae bacterium]|nr:hypothetical protein [Alphaproteobacteria bacterium]
PMETVLGSLVNDVPGFKKAVRSLKARHDVVIWAAAGLFEAETKTVADVVKKADLSLLIHERDELLGKPPEPWGAYEDADPIDIKLYCLPPDAAEDNWLFRFHHLKARLKASYENTGRA